MWQRELCRECEAPRCQGAETQEPATLFKEMLVGGVGGGGGCYLLARFPLCLQLSSKHLFFLSSSRMEVIFLGISISSSDSTKSFPVLNTTDILVHPVHSFLELASSFSNNQRALALIDVWRKPTGCG